MGARPHQTVADTLAVLPRIELHPADTVADDAALNGLARWLVRFSPAVGLHAPDSILVDTDGCAHLWGGERAMAETIRDRLSGQGIPARVAIAGTFAAAWALAHGHPDDLVVATADTGACIGPLPVSALRIDPETVQRLSALGIRRVDQLMSLPRPALMKRFGPALVLRLDQAMGRIQEVVPLLQPPTPWAARRVFAEPLSRPESLVQVLCDLSAELCGHLASAGLAARRFLLVAHRIDGEDAGRSVVTALGMRDPKRLVALFTPKLETIDPGFGVESVVLKAMDAAPLETVQGDLVTARTDNRRVDLAPLIDRLRNRLGADNVWRAAPVERYVPERAFARVHPFADVKVSAWPVDRPRPVRLFSKPYPIEAMAPVPDDPPVLFRWRGRAHRVQRAEGPERIGSEWWREPLSEGAIDRIRDYYRVEDEQGQRFWVFRTGLYGHARPTRWFLHGLFA
ncbi:MAG: DNA polymerase Y family protein [Hyphomonadaceae bacterium]|nr:DNA polymerase Y family protein [Hyphomonadaceae bacterium]